MRMSQMYIFEDLSGDDVKVWREQGLDHFGVEILDVDGQPLSTEISVKHIPDLIKALQGIMEMSSLPESKPKDTFYQEWD